MLTNNNKQQTCDKGSCRSDPRSDNQILLGAFQDKSEYVGYIVDYPELKGGIGLRNKYDSGSSQIYLCKAANLFVMEPISSILEGEL